MSYKVDPLSFGDFGNQNQQSPSGFRYDYGDVQQPEPVQPMQPEVDEQGIIADFIDKVQGGAWTAAADIITGTRGLLTDDRVWEMEQYLRDQVTAQDETLSQAQLEADKLGAFESPRSFMGAVASGIGSIAPSMVAGGVAGIGGRALASKAAQMAGAGEKVQSGAEAVGQFAGAGMAGAPMIGGSAANQISEELAMMPNVEFSQLPNFDQYYQTALQTNPDDPNSAMQMARDKYTADAEETAVRYGAAVGAASMGVAAPYLEKILKGGQGILPGAWLGARTEAAQEGFESGAQEAVVNPLAGRDVGEGVAGAALEGAVLGGLIGGGVGGVGGLRGAPGEEVAPIEETPAGYTEPQQQPYGPQPFTGPGQPTQADIYNDPFIEEQPVEEEVIQDEPYPYEEVQYPKPEKAITKMNPEELQQYSAEINNYADQIAEQGDPNNEIQAVEEIQRRVGILQEKPTLDETAQEAATSIDNELPEPTEAQKEAGNYKKAHHTLNGMNIAIENPKGSERKGKDKTGKDWSTTMNDHYGYFKGTEGFDKDHLDVFMGPTAEQAEQVYVVDQVTPSTGKFDEHKVMMGYDNIKQAEDAYKSNYDKDWKGLSNITEMPMDEFKQWAYSNKPKQGPLAEPETTAPLIKAPVVDLKERRDRKKAKQSYADYRQGVKDAARQKESEAIAKRDRDQQLAEDKARKEKAAKEEAEKPVVDEDGYHTDLVKQSYAHSSNSPGRAATIHKREFNEQVQELTDSADKLAKTPEQKEALTQAVDKFKQDYLDNERTLMSARSGVVSSHIAGRSKFNAKQAGRRGNALDRAQERFNKWLTGAKDDVERAVQAARTPEAVETDRKEATAKREKAVHTSLMKDIAGGLAAMVEPGMEPAAFRPKATKKLEQALEQNEAETLRLMEVINKALKDTGGIEKAVGTRSKFWKMYKAAKEAAAPEKETTPAAKKKTLKDVFKGKSAPEKKKAEPVETKKPTPAEQPAEYTIDYHNDFLKKLNSGDITLEEFQASVKNFREKKDEILAMLNSRQYTIPQLRSMAGYMMRGDEKKSEIADNVFDRLQTAYLLDNPRPNLVWTMGVGNMQKGVDEQQEKINKLIDDVTQADLDNYARGRKDAKAKREADKKAREEAVKEPKSLDDFREFIRVKGKDALSPDQLESYDRLITAEMIARRKEIADREASRQARSVGDVDVETAQTKHTKTGEDLYVVKLSDRIDRERFNDMRRVSKQYGGFYSRYSVGDAIPGFQFKKESDRDEFLAAISTGEVKTPEKPKTNQERIGEMGDRLITRGEESLAQDRQANTARRAGMAASAEAKAESDIVTGKLLKAISEADTDYLQGITALTQLEELQKVLNRAKYKAPDELKDKDSMSRKTLKEGVELNDYIQYAEFPSPIVRRDGLQSLARDLEDKTGYKNTAKSINAVLKRTKDENINLDNYPRIDQAKIKKYAKLPGVYGSSQWIADYIQSSERLEKIGITSLPHLRMALRELNAIQEKVAGVSPEQKEAKRIKQMERELVGKKMPGFFPTPKPLVEELIDDADIQKGDKVLEPSAGKGDIADVLKEQGANVYAVEMQSGLRDILESKGHKVVGNDFMEITDNYDKIVMNPPFEDFQDIDHVMKAYELLNPDGRVVAVMGAGVNNTRKKATEFRAWVKEKGGTIEPLPEGSFKSAFRPTGVNTVKVIIDKPAAAKKTGTEDYSKIDSDVEFNESKVTNDNGDLLTVYHGSSEIINEFDENKIGKHDAGTEGRGFYFSSSFDSAKSWADYSVNFEENKGHVVAAQLNIKNPYKITKITAPRNLQDDSLESLRFTKKLIKQGYDGVEYTLLSGDKNYVVFNSDQIKILDKSAAVEKKAEKQPADKPAAAKKTGTEDYSALNDTIPVNTNSKEFKNWFGNSKVVDENGDPLVVYRGEHGKLEKRVNKKDYKNSAASESTTPVKGLLEEIEDGDIGSHTLRSSISFGDKETASYYAVTPNIREAITYSPRVIPAYLKIENPIVLDPNTSFFDWDIMIDYIGKRNSKKIALILNDYIIRTNAWQDGDLQKYKSVKHLLNKNPNALKDLYIDAFHIFDNKEAVDIFKKAGFDGAIHGGSGYNQGEKEYKVFDKKQIKSAISIDYSKIPKSKKKPVSHPDFSFTGVSKPAGLSERQIFNIINDKYGRPMFGASKFKNVDIINDPNKKWRGVYKDGQITLNAFYMTKDDAVRILQHEKVHEYIKQDPEFRKVAKDILKRAMKRPNSAAGKALEIAKNRVPKDSKEYDRKIFEETMAYLVQYYNKPEVKGIFKRIATAIAKFFRGKLGINMNEADAVDYLKDMVKAEAVGTETEQKAYKQEMADLMAGADVEEIEYSALGDAAGNITDRMTEAFESDFMDTMKSKINSQKWGVLNVRQIADVLGKYAPEIKNNYIDRFKRFEADMNKMKQDAGDIAIDRQKLSKGENEKLAQVQHEATIASYDPSWEPVEDPKITHTQEELETRQAIKDDYEGLTDEAQKVYSTERTHHKTMHDARLKALTERINAIEADEGFKESMVEKLHQEFDKAMKKGPYFPLARFGQYWVSSENSQGVKSFDMFENEYSQTRFVEKMRADPNEEVVGFGKKLDNLKSVDGVSGQFIADVDKLIRKGGDSPVTQQIRDDVFQLYLESLPELSARKKYLHRGKVKGFAKDQARAFAQKARADANDVARLRHIHVLQNMIDDAETSLNIASSTKLKRQFSDHVEALQDAADNVPFGITDYEIQELNEKAPFKVFTLNQTADPEAEIDRILKKEQTLLENAKKITEDKVIFVANGLNELKKSHEAMVNNEVHPIASNLNSLGFLWYLGASPAAALVNLTQTPTVSLPMMLADKSLKNSARYLSGAVKDFIAGKGTIEPTLNTQERKAFNEWHDSGLLENTQAHDLSGVADSGIDTGTFKNKAMRMISFMFHRAEVMNREVTALATYRAAKAGGATHEQAVKKGADLTWNSHLDYGASNRARFMRGNTMRVITQFKQYSQGITYIYGKTLLDTFKGETKQDRQQAMKLLGMLVASQIAVAGTLGLPMAGVVMGITQGLKDAFDDDDEATSVKAEFRQAMSDFAGQTGGQAISHGLIDAFTPLSMSGRLSMADLWVRTPDFDQEGKAEALSYIEALGGPMVSIFTNMFMGKDSLKEGNFMRAAEQMTPKMVKDFMRATRYATEGNLTKAGLKVKDMTPAEMIAQALGFSSSEVSEIRELSTQIKNVEKKRTTRRKEIIDNWMNSDDRDMTEIKNWNERYPRDRITSKTLRAARRSKMRYAAQVVKGVRQTKRNRDLLEEYDF